MRTVPHLVAPIEEKNCNPNPTLQASSARAVGRVEVGHTGGQASRAQPRLLRRAECAGRDELWER
jgi:hypothetical protein